MNPIFIFLHGGGQGGWVWDEVAALLNAQGATCLQLDVPGCGAKRGLDTDGLDVAAIIADLAADMSAAGLRDIILVGHSQAGTILPLLALEMPQGLQRIVYLCCSAPLPGQNILAMMGQSVHGAHPDEVGWVMDRATAGKHALYRQMFCNDMDAAQTATFMQRPARDDWPMAANIATDWHYDHLERIASTYILCEQDQALPPAWQRRFAQRLHCDRIVTLDAGHQAMTTQPAALAKLLLAEGEGN